MDRCEACPFEAQPTQGVLLNKALFAAFSSLPLPITNRIKKWTLTTPLKECQVKTMRAQSRGFGWGKHNNHAAPVSRSSCRPRLHLTESQRLHLYSAAWRRIARRNTGRLPQEKHGRSF